MAVRSMARGEPLDMQRETRWPNQTNPDIEVEWKPWQDDSDFSDTEGIFNPHGPVHSPRTPTKKGPSADGANRDNTLASAASDQEIEE
jgi:hypothetical protein